MNPVLVDSGSDPITELSALYEISSVPTSLISREDLGWLVLDKTVRLFRARIALLYLLNGIDGREQLWAVRGMPRRDASPAISPSAALSRVFASERPVTIQGVDAVGALGLVPRAYRARQALLLPIRVGQKVCALLGAFRLTDEPFAQRDAALLGVLGDRVGAALETLNLFDEMEERQRALEIEIAERHRVEQERERLIAELQDTLARVEVLSGLLPICAWCKRIRSDDGYWESVEVYIHEHSHATFTHSICPDCMKKVGDGTWSDELQ
ncbi:MAG TPA: GAF domain-containing protein [Chloroflexi bacterium]|nr:GAF domain-containing protein [Chloroflexota bacterium]